MSYLANQQNPFDSNNLNKQILFNEFFSRFPNKKIKNIIPVVSYSNTAFNVFDANIFYIGDFYCYRNTTVISYGVNTYNELNVLNGQYNADLAIYDSTLNQLHYTTGASFINILFFKASYVNLVTCKFIGFKIEIE